jgi:hypothetical protein
MATNAALPLTTLCLLLAASDSISTGAAGATTVWPPPQPELGQRSRDHAGARPNIVLLFVDVRIALPRVVLQSQPRTISHMQASC